MSRWLRGWSLVALWLFLAPGCRGESTPSGPPAAAPAPAADPLPSWNEGAARKSIVDFVARVTREGGPDFVPLPERIATFDNDGTLWSEKPVPFQVLFAVDRVKALAPQHLEWKTREPFTQPTGCSDEKHGNGERPARPAGRPVRGHALSGFETTDPRLRVPATRRRN